MDNDFSYDLKFKLKPESEIIVNSYEETAIAGIQSKFEVNPSIHFAISADINVVETVSGSSLRKLKMKQRKCLFSDEKKFKYYRDEKYSYSTCMKECRINRALDICGCLPPVYQNDFMVNLTKCDFYSLKCLKDQRVVDDLKCNCLLPCEFTSVHVDRIEKKFIGQKFDGNQFDKAISEVTVSLKQFPLIRLQQELKFAIVDYLVAFGSIFALFSSFSVLSIIELLIYLVKYYSPKMSAKSDIN